ncbi:ArnT family glycosyltransferase [Halobacteriaceae archaeon GCM10025711]
MSHGTNERRNEAAGVVSYYRGRGAWLLTAIAAAAVVYVTYLATHPYPAYAGGLYLDIAEHIIANDYALPERIPGYTAEGVPFAYPPLLFYATAVVHDLTGVDPVALTRFVPGIAVMAYLVPYYFIADELLDARYQAGLATVLFAVTPTVLRWHLSAGGLVRAPAVLVMLTGVFFGLKLFRTGDRRWLLPAGVLFGLMVLSHPHYTVFFVLSYLLFFAFFDRTLGGLVNGAVVAAGGLVLASPWWLQVVATHGADIFLTASGTHTGLGGGPYRLLDQFVYPLGDLDGEILFYVGAYLGAGYLLARRRYFLPAWMVAATYFIGKNRFLFVAGSMLTAVFVFEWLVPAAREHLPTLDRGRVVPVLTVLTVTLLALTMGTLYGASALNTAHEHSPTQPQYIDDHDVEAMQWMAANTPEDAGFVVAGDAAEWVPVHTDRTILVGPWGWSGRTPVATTTRSNATRTSPRARTRLASPDTSRRPTSMPTTSTSRRATTPSAGRSTSRTPGCGRRWRRPTGTRYATRTRAS